MDKIKILIVCAWPLGGIRTFLKYNYHYFPRNEFEITLLANPSSEKIAVEEDMNAENIKVIWAKTYFGKNLLFLRVASLLKADNFDVIHSQGWISAFNTSLGNIFFRVPHILTIHGILEEKYLSGMFGWFKKLLLKSSLKNVNVFHGVSNDILNHLKDVFPFFKNRRVKWSVINNGINTTKFLEEIPNASEKLHDKLSIPKDTFVFGFFGRFMPQKGFNYIIDAVNIINEKKNLKEKYIVLAVGSGDYEREYKNDIQVNKLEKSFVFLPFISDISTSMKGCDTILMPSIWEAWGLLATESLCAGIPIIASDCIGLREATKDTPAVVISKHNAEELAEAMVYVMNHRGIKAKFESFKTEAANRFDVKLSAEKIISLVKSSVNYK